MNTPSNHATSMLEAADELLVDAEAGSLPQPQATSVRVGQIVSCSARASC